MSMAIDMLTIATRQYDVRYGADETTQTPSVSKSVILRRMIRMPAEAPPGLRTLTDNTIPLQGAKEYEGFPLCHRIEKCRFW